MGAQLETFSPEAAPHRVLELAALLVPQLLAGDHPQLRILRAQYERARVSRVESSGVGFFVHYEVPADMPTTVPPDLAGGDAHISLAGMEPPAGCVLFVRGGRLSMFEAYCHVDAWPADREVLAIDDVLPLAIPES